MDFNGRQYLSLYSDNCTQEALSNIEGNAFYYPHDISYDVGTIRYRICSVSSGDKTSFVARLDTDTLDPVPSENDIRYIIIYNDIVEVLYYYTVTTAGLMTLLILIFLTGCIVFPIFDIRNAIRRHRKKK